MAPTAGYAFQALALRRWAIRFLGSSSASADIQEPDAPEDAWRLFIAMERCASALRNALGARGTRSAILDQAATGEAQRSLSARAQLATLARMAGQRGWTVVALKGSVAAAEGRPYYLQDVDILIPRAQAADVAREIGRELGLRPQGRMQSRHLPIMGGDDTLPVEVHLNIDTRGTRLTERAWWRVTPLAGVPGLFRLSPADHCLHLLTHVAIDHPDRRGRLRDSLLLRDALKECSEGDRDEIDRGVRENPYAAALLAELDLARGLAEGKAVDQFERSAFTSYWLVEHSLPWSRGSLPAIDPIFGTVWKWVLILSSGWPVNPWLIDSVRENSADRSELRLVSFLERRLPPAGKALRFAVRALHYAIALCGAWPIAIFARRAATRAGAERTGSSRSSRSPALANVSRPSDKP